jgi:hypothetical protein
MKAKKRFVVVTTDKERRGVFGGTLLTEKGSVVELENAKMAVYWSSNVKGVFGLAKTGPLKGCRISPAVPKIKLNGITSIIECTEEAVKNWGENIWD